MKRSYLGAICGDEGSYGIVFRDLPGCVSAGDTLDEVLAMGAEALEGHIAVMLDAGEAIPEPTGYTLSDVEAWLSDEGEATGEHWVGLYPVAITIPEEPDLVTIRLKADLVDKIAEIVERNLEGLDRSNSRAFIERAMEHEFDRLKKTA